MTPYSAVSHRYRMGALPAAYRAMPPAEPPPGEDPVFAGYRGVPGVLEAIAVTGILGASTWMGIRTGLDGKTDDVMKALGWTAAIGSTALLAAYLVPKTNLANVPFLSVHPPN